MNSKKLWLTGIASFLPIITLPVSFSILILLAVLDGTPPQDYSEQNGGVALFATMIMFFSIIIIAGCVHAVKIYFIYDTFNSPYVKKNNRVLWLVLLSLLAIFVSPFYWYMNLFKHRNDERENEAIELEQPI
ncbi:MAG: hypothetical protein ACM3U1_06340 [Chloroflexota bacterium]